MVYFRRRSTSIAQVATDYSEISNMDFRQNKGFFYLFCVVQYGSMGIYQSNHQDIAHLYSGGPIQFAAYTILFFSFNPDARAHTWFLMSLLSIPSPPISLLLLQPVCPPLTSVHLLLSLLAFPGTFVWFGVYTLEWTGPWQIKHYFVFFIIKRQHDVMTIYFILFLAVDHS